MAHQTEVLLILIVAIAATDYALGLTQKQPAYSFDMIVKAGEHRVNGICPFGWVLYGSRCFTYQATNMDWASAEKRCLNLGGHLASIHNRNEQELVRALIRAHDNREAVTWIGLSNCEKKRSFFWSDGTLYDYGIWAPNEPNFRYDECCVHMNYGDRKAWNDYRCEGIHPFVCAKNRG